MVRSLVTMVITLASALPEPVQYDGFSVVEVKPESAEDLLWLETSHCQSLSELVGIGQPYQALCDRGKARDLRREARRKGLDVHYVSKHLGREIREEAKDVDNFQNDGEEEETSSDQDTAQGQGRLVRVKKRVKKKPGQKNKQGRFRHTSYLGYQLMFQYLDKLENQYDSMTSKVIGMTNEGRNIKVVKINSNNTQLPIIFIDAGIHAREWISPASTLFLIEKLAKQISKGRGKNDIAKYQWHIIPLANPDGYEYTRSHNRLWRKNTVPLPNTDCIGVDLNRNFPEGYGIGASKNPCSEVYQGSHPFSELESITMRNYVHSLHNVAAAISIHSFGSVLIYPWGYKTAQHPRRSKLASLANSISEEVQEHHQELYQPGTAKEVFGAWGIAGGATDDWYITQNIDYSYTFELPEHDEDGAHGFLLPASNIVKVGKQLVTAFVTMARKLE